MTNFVRSIFFLALLSWAFDALAQVPQEPSNMPEQWQLSLDVIKSKAQSLVVENNGLQDEYHRLLAKLQELRKAVADQSYRNGQMSDFLKRRHGQTDQEVRLKELAQAIRAKRQLARSLDEQTTDLQHKQAALDEKIQQLKNTLWAIDQQAKNQAQMPGTTAPKEDQGLANWRKQLQEANKQETLLENELLGLKPAGNTANASGAVLEEENKKLEERLEVLRLEKLKHVKESSETAIAQVKAQRYQALKKDKDELMAEISGYEARLDQLRETSLVALSWPAKKRKLVHELVQADALNSRMAAQIKVLREDIHILKDKVTKLERRINSHGKTSRLESVDLKSTP